LHARPGLLLISLPAYIVYKEPAKIYKRLFSIAREVILLLQAIYRSYKAFPALLQALPSLILTRNALLFHLRALPSLTCLRKPFITRTLTCNPLPSLTVPAKLPPSRGPPQASLALELKLIIIAILVFVYIYISSNCLPTSPQACLFTGSQTCLLACPSLSSLSLFSCSSLSTHFVHLPSSLFISLLSLSLSFKLSLALCLAFILLPCLKLSFRLPPF
jgi:hypothetical protein